MRAFSPTGVEIKGTAETVCGTAIILRFERAENGTIEIEYEGTTDVCWDSQTTDMRDGKRVYVDESGDTWTEDQLVLQEDDEGGDDENDK